MPISTIIIVNLSLSDVPLEDLGVTVPGSGTLDIGQSAFGFEILRSNDLRSQVQSGSLTLDLGKGSLSMGASLELLSYAPTAGGVQFDDSLTGFTADTVQDAINTMATTVPARVDVYDSTGGQTYTSSFITVQMDTVRQSFGSAFTIQPDGSLLCNTEGSYEVVYDVTTGILSGTARSNTESFLFLNGVAVPGTRRACYNRTVGNDQDSATGRAFLNLVNGDTLSVRVRRFQGTDTMTTVQSSTLSVVEFSGAQGPPGTDGAPGVPGPTGSGTNINVAADGVVNPGGPFSLLNFIGGFSAFDAGGGQVNLSVSSAGIVFPGSPIDGQVFYRTDLQWEFRWDATRGKWLGVTAEFEGAGFNGTVNNGYLRRFNGMTTSATLGTWIPYDITIVGVSGKWANSVTGSLDVRRNGVTISNVPYTSSVSVGDLTLNDDFAADANLSFFVNGSHATPQVRVWYRRRAV